MITLHGRGVSRGIAIGRARVLRQSRRTLDASKAGDPDAEKARYEAARRRTVTELQELYKRTKEEIGEEQAGIFSVHAMMARDEDFDEAVNEKIESGHYAEYAVEATAKQFSDAFAGMDDDYMRERAGDVMDVAERMLGHLEGDAERMAPLLSEEGEIVCARDLSPSQTVQLDRRRVCAFVTGEGSVNSHTAILSRSMDIPAVIGVGREWERIEQGALVAVDAHEGVVYLDPSEDVLRGLKLRMQADAEEKRLLEEYRGRESKTADGRRIEICANVGSLEDAQAAIRYGADGIGLFRSEFLYMGRKDPPGEEEQFSVYRRVLESMPDKRVVVRTLDIGADKQAPYFHLPKEENPALGLRGCRVSLSRPDVFLTQCRALQRAAVYGRLAVMFPMVTSREEVAQLRSLWDRAAMELQRQGIETSERVEIGIMIETPAAALICDRLAPLVDFFSIGSNDLTQYTLAADRQNAALESVYFASHEAVLRLIRHTVQSAHRAGIWVGVCGEMGADHSMTELLLNMGVDEISVVPGTILPLRKKVCGLNLGQPEQIRETLFAEGEVK